VSDTVSRQHPRLSSPRRQGSVKRGPGGLVAGIASYVAVVPKAEQIRELVRVRLRRSE